MLRKGKMLKWLSLRERYVIYRLWSTEIRGRSEKTEGETALWNKPNLSMKSSSKFGIQAGEEAIHLGQEPAAGSTTSTPP